MASVIVLDANVVIAHFAVSDAHAEAALDILDTEEELAIHPVNLAETLVRPAGEGTEEETRRRLDAIGIGQLLPPVDEPLAVARLRVETRLGLPDCYPLAAALHTGATLATFDARLASAARERGLEVLGVDGAS
ncbi:MAG: type II toxin-antitoxin system VapC family toxin [Humibacter sp.]